MNLNPLTATKYFDNPERIYMFLINRVAWVTLFIVFVLLFLKCNTLTGIITFLTVAGASLASGAAVGFLFGLPRSEKYRFIKKEDADHTAKEYSYGDNTNLEEISDWLTKIIVGISLIKIDTILEWIHLSARSIKNAFMQGCIDAPFLNAYVFGYAVMILYFLAGGGLCYLWARTHLPGILTKKKMEQLELEKKQLEALVLARENPGLNQDNANAPVEDPAGNIPIPEIAGAHARGAAPQQGREVVAARGNMPTDEFRTLIESVYNAKAVHDKSDLQKGRWGGKSQNGNKVLEVAYDVRASFNSLYQIQLKVRSLDAANPLTGQVAFFLHDTFPTEIVYAEAQNNLAQIKIVAWEAFVAGARTEDGTELELDLNTVKGFPDGFYWKG